MNIVFAQLKKDIQCQRSALVLWGACLGMGVISLMFLHALMSLNGITDVHSADMMSNAKVSMGLLSLGVLSVFCVFVAGFGLLLLVPVLVIRIVHEDALMGTTAFWLTRPIPREKLLAAKALLIAILPLPLILLGGSNVHFGVGGIGRGHFWTAELAWIAAFAAISSITSGVGDFLAYGLALVFGKAVCAGILGAVWTRLHGNSSVFPGATPDFIHLCYFAGFSAVFIHQYLTLQTRRSLTMLIAILVAVSFLQMLIGPVANIPAVP